jgi:CheY-like chemotaxis protein
MLNIINDIIDISKIEAGLMKLDIYESDINEQIGYIYTFFKPEAESKGISLSLKMPEKETIIKTDQEKVYAIFANLVKNGIKYTEKGSIEMGYNIKTGTKPDELEFYVKDTGIGIPKDRHKAIFDRFIQADIANQKANQGAGLGLAITKAYVEMLGGKIWVESEEDKGSTFYFTLPYKTEPSAETNDRQLQPSGKYDGIRKLKILIAEDDEVSEMLLDETVIMFARETLKARTGVEAVKACRDNPDIDLIMMDIRMPELSGYKATQQIREFNKEVIIIAQTAYGQTGDREKSIESGCNDYLAKPVSENELHEMIQKYFG